MGAALSRLPPADRDTFHGRRLEMADRHALLGSPSRRRLRYYVAGAVICIPLVTFLFTPLGFRALWIQLPLAAAYGVALALLKPRGTLSGLLLMLTGLLTMVLCGGRVVSFVGALSLFSYFVFGLFVGAGEEMKAIDGD